MSAAESSMESALTLAERHPRSASSRAYFAAYAAMHAMLISEGETPPARGNWPHEGLGELVRTVLARGEGRRRRGLLVQVKSALNELQAARIRADYAPTARLQGAEALWRARLLMALARRRVS